MKQLATQIFDALRRMDREATPVEPPWPTGLRDFAVFRKQGYSVRGSRAREDAISDGLIDILRGSGYECRPRPHYPNSGKKCDIWLKGRKIDSCWIEVKGAWRHFFNQEDTDCSVRRRQCGPFPTHLRAAAADVDKLLRELDKFHASHLGVLLIGFGSQHFPIGDQHISHIGLRAAGWSYFSDQWDDHAWKFGRIRCGFWCREL
jgi:hypothetical protein